MRCERRGAMAVELGATEFILVTSRDNLQREVYKGLPNLLASQLIDDGQWPARFVPAKIFFVQYLSRWRRQVQPIADPLWCLLRFRRAWEMARFPRLEFAGSIFCTSLLQVAHERGVLKGQPIFEFIQRIHRFQNFYRNFHDGLRRFHGLNVDSNWERAKKIHPRDRSCAPSVRWRREQTPFSRRRFCIR